MAIPIISFNEKKREQLRGKDKPEVFDEISPSLRRILGRILADNSHEKQTEGETKAPVPRLIG